MREYRISPLGVFHPEVRTYGLPVARPKAGAANSCGEGWQCWSSVGTLENQSQWNIGIVEANLHDPVVHLVECHPTRQEWVFAFDAPVIQVVALSDQNNPAHADAATSKAVLLLPGEGLLIHSGIWHAAGFPANLQRALYGFALAPAQTHLQESGMVPFLNEDRVRIDIH